MNLTEMFVVLVHLVQPQQLSSSICFTAYLTKKWFLASMTQHVSVQVTGMLKNLSAYITHIGFYKMSGDRSDSNMNPLVQSQVLNFSESLTAYITHMGFCKTCVDPLVYFLKMNASKNLAADITIILACLGLLFLLQVSALVLIQVTGSGKSPITHITNIGSVTSMDPHVYPQI